MVGAHLALDWQVGKPANTRQGPRQIIAQLKSVDTKFHILRNSKKFQENDYNKGISINEDLTRDCLLFYCRQLCHQRRLKMVSSCLRRSGPHQVWLRDAG